MNREVWMGAPVDLKRVLMVDPQRIPDSWGWLDDLEKMIERWILEEKDGVVAVNCALLGRLSGPTRVIERAGVVPLRWAAPRLLLVRPDQARLLEDPGEELVRCWKLWRYKFDPRVDGVSIGSPNLIQKEIEKVCAGVVLFEGGSLVIRSRHQSP